VFITAVPLTNEARFTGNGLVNLYSVHALAEENPQVMWVVRYRHQHQFWINVLIGLLGNYIMAPTFCSLISMVLPISNFYNRIATTCGWHSISHESEYGSCTTERLHIIVTRYAVRWTVSFHRGDPDAKDMWNQQYIHPIYIQWTSLCGNTARISCMPLSLSPRTSSGNECQMQYKLYMRHWWYRNECMHSSHNM
jgi:hypothetical protein